MRALGKVAIGVAALATLVWLFLSTLQDTIAEPYGGIGAGGHAVAR